MYAKKREMEYVQENALNAASTHSEAIVVSFSHAIKIVCLLTESHNIRSSYAFECQQNGEIQRERERERRGKKKATPFLKFAV